MARFDEWKRMHMEEFADVQDQIHQLQVAVLRNPVITELRIKEIEDRLKNIELWNANMTGRLWMLGFAMGFIQFLTMIILHFWKQAS
jgi:hypothetical protein